MQKPKRNPVVLQKKAWVDATTLTVLGVDPGFAAMGLAVLEKSTTGPVKTLELRSVKTQKSSKKALRGMRIAADDQRRITELHNALAETAVKYNVHAIAYEVYQPFKAQGGNAWKASRAEGMVQCFALERQLLLLPFLPVDLKLAIVGKRSASKLEVQQGLYQKAENFEAMIDEILKGEREHVADAAGYAYLAFAEMVQIRRMAGIAI